MAHLFHKVVANSVNILLHYLSEVLSIHLCLVIIYFIHCKLDSYFIFSTSIVLNNVSGEGIKLFKYLYLAQLCVFIYIHWKYILYTVNGLYTFPHYGGGQASLDRDGEKL